MNIAHGAEKAGWVRWGGVVWLRCPTCGYAASLTDHEIASDGIVTPSVVCPKECGFHDNVKLLDWNKGE